VTVALAAHLRVSPPPKSRKYGVKKDLSLLTGFGFAPPRRLLHELVERTIATKQFLR
jgi:hypothetical protein